MLLLLLLIPLWMLIVALVAGLCAAAHAGDRPGQALQPATVVWDLPPSVAISPAGAEDEPRGSVARSAA
jgi:hypothetical protein